MTKIYSINSNENARRINFTKNYQNCQIDTLVSLVKRMFFAFIARKLEFFFEGLVYHILYNIFERNQSIAQMTNFFKLIFLNHHFIYGKWNEKEDNNNKFFRAYNFTFNTFIQQNVFVLDIIFLTNSPLCITSRLISRSKIVKTVYNYL